MRLIDADVLRNNLQALAYDDWNQGVTTSWADAYSEFADMVEGMPTIETIESETEEEAYERGYTAGQMAQRKTGHKINQHQYPAKWVCSECGAKHFDFSDKFCSECGVNVEEGEQE